MVGWMAVNDTEVFPALAADTIILKTSTVVTVVTVQSELGPTHLKYPLVMGVGISAAAINRGAVVVEERQSITGTRIVQNTYTVDLLPAVGDDNICI
jgi:uncharacterized protein with ACT and thioredoxin-like domain